ncbi:unnamed protein product, partial [Cylicostephanus goldi]
MARILAGLEDNCLAYIDDVVIFNKDFLSHLASLKKFSSDSELSTSKYPPRSSSNVIADYLSRISYPSQAFHDDHPESEDIVEFPYCLSVNPSDIPIIAGNMPIAIKPYDFLIEQKKDDFCAEIFDFLETDRVPEFPADSDKVRWLSLAEQCVIGRNGCLYHRAIQTRFARCQSISSPHETKRANLLAYHTSPSAG